jgi:hypothetical protein
MEKLKYLVIGLRLHVRHAKDTNAKATDVNLIFKIDLP